MHFGFALDSSDIDFWNIDLLDTHLGLLETDIPSKHFVCLQEFFQTSSRHVFSAKIFRYARVLGRRKIVTVKRCWRRLQEESWRSF